MPFKKQDKQTNKKKTWGIRPKLSKPNSNEIELDQGLQNLQP